MEGTVQPAALPLAHPFPTPRGHKKHAASTRKTKLGATPGARFTCIIPLPLRRHMYDNQHHILNGEMIVPPSTSGKPNITAILEMFSGSNGNESPSVVYFIQGMKLIFNAAIDRCLLYRNEQVMHKELLADGKRVKDSKKQKRPRLRKSVEDDPLTPCDVYGVEHLMRLIHSSPHLLDQYCHYNREGSLTVPGRRKLEFLMASLIEFIGAQAATLFVNEYATLSGAISQA